MRGVIIAYPSEKLALQLKRELTACGLEVMAVYAKGSSVLNAADFFGQGVIICPQILPDMPANHLAQSLPPSFDVVALANGADSDSLTSSLSILSLPLDRGEFRSLMTALCAQSAYIAPKRAGRRRAADSELIKQAKQALIFKRGMSESQAHRYLQHTAMNKGLKITELARHILGRQNDD